MPFDDPDHDDPMELVGMEIDVSGPEALREMVACHAEEFARMGYSIDEILALFRDPFYGSAHAAFLALGEEEAGAIAIEAARPWAAFRRARVSRDEDRSAPVDSETQEFPAWPWEV